MKSSFRGPSLPLLAVARVFRPFRVETRRAISTGMLRSGGAALLLPRFFQDVLPPGADFAEHAVGVRRGAVARAFALASPGLLAPIAAGVAGGRTVAGGRAGG